MCQARTFALWPPRAITRAFSVWYMMIPVRMNELMRPLWRASAEAGDKVHLTENLLRLTRRGWVVESSGALLLEDCYGLGWPPEHLGELVAEDEHEVNDVYIDRDDFPTQRDVHLRRSVRRAQMFAAATLRVAAGMPAAERLVAVICTWTDEEYLLHGTNVRLLTTRGGFDDRYGDDLECYQFQAIAIVGPLK